MEPCSRPAPPCSTSRTARNGKAAHATRESSMTSCSRISRASGTLLCASGQQSGSRIFGHTAKPTLDALFHTNFAMILSAHVCLTRLDGDAPIESKSDGTFNRGSSHAHSSPRSRVVHHAAGRPRCLSPHNRSWPQSGKGGDDRLCQLLLRPALARRLLGGGPLLRNRVVSEPTQPRLATLFLWPMGVDIRLWMVLGVGRALGLGYVSLRSL